MPKNKIDFIERQIHSELVRLSEMYAVIVLIGPRQSGKTTLCKNQFLDYHYINLKNPSAREQLLTTPKAFLEQYATGMILDEVQHLPELLSYIQVVVDENEEAKFVLTGRSDFSLMQGPYSIIGRKGSNLNFITVFVQRNWLENQ